MKTNTLDPRFKGNKELRVVNIIGGAPSANVEVNKGENWGVNHSWIYGHKLSKLFFVDGATRIFKSFDSLGINIDDFIQYLKDNPDLEMPSAYAEHIKTNDGEILKTTVAMPHQFMRNLIPGTFVNSSIAHMFALVAVQEELGNKKVDIVNIHGVEIWASFDKDEYEYQRECIDFWIPFLYGRGIQVNIPAYIAYSKNTIHNMYGYTR